MVRFSRFNLHLLAVLCASMHRLIVVQINSLMKMFSLSELVGHSQILNDL
jgi:hypothetical protein